MEFIADVMLGRLAKRLRLLGFDVFYDRTFDDNQIIRLSLEQNRLILTRDTALSKRPLAKNHLFIRSENVDKQVDQVLSLFSLDKPTRPLSRCSECNTVLTVLSGEDARDLVPEYVHKKNDRFLQCEKCDRVYWTGTHVQRMGFRK